MIVYDPATVDGTSDLVGLALERKSLRSMMMTTMGKVGWMTRWRILLSRDEQFLQPNFGNTRSVYN